MAARCTASSLSAKAVGLATRNRNVLISLREAGAMATHCHGFDQALRVLEGWGLLRRVAVMTVHVQPPEDDIGGAIRGAAAGACPGRG
jgi:hypothetical protein